MATDERRRKVMEIIDWPLADEIYGIDLLDMAMVHTQICEAGHCMVCGTKAGPPPEESP